MRIFHCLIAAWIGILAGAMAVDATAQTAGTCEHRAAPAGVSGKRVAVIVGNGGYANGIPALRNPAQDAQAVAKAMGALGFEIFLAGDADSEGLQNCLATAYASAAGADVALFYYSGHGIQIRDENYLVAVDATSKDLQHGFVPVQPIVDTLQKSAKATLVFLDACRSNPMAEGGQAGLSVSTGRGLARVKGAGATAAPGAVQARGLMVAYATSPNAVALDGTGELSPFTGAFVKAVGTSGYSIQRIMSDVTKAVGEETDWAQTPWMKSSLTDELKLGGGQTLAEARSVSDNRAAQALQLLYRDNNRSTAMMEALKGLPSRPDEAALKRFAKAYLALYSAVQSRQYTLPIDPGQDRIQMTIAISLQGRIAAYKPSADYESGELELWSTADRKVLARPATGKGSLSALLFSPHGNVLAAVGRDVTVWNSLDGSRLFGTLGSGNATKLSFSPDDSRLLVTGDYSRKMTIIEVATGRLSLVIDESALGPGFGKKKHPGVSQVIFGSPDTLCFSLVSEDGKEQAVGIYDLKQRRTTRLRRPKDPVIDLRCDAAGKYMVTSYREGALIASLEIWDLAADSVKEIKAPILVLSSLDPRGNYVSLFSQSREVQGLYDLATGKKATPPTIPDGFVIITPPRLRSDSGGLIGHNTSLNPLLEWPDESLFGPALIDKALAELTPAQREEVARDRITFAEVVAAP